MSTPGHPCRRRGPPRAGARRRAAGCRRSRARGRGRTGPSTAARPRSPSGTRSPSGAARPGHHHHHHHHHRHHRHHHHLAVEAQNVLEYPWRPVEVELPRGEAEGVAQRQDLRCNTGLR